MGEGGRGTIQIQIHLSNHPAFEGKIQLNYCKVLLDYILAIAKHHDGLLTR